MIRELRVATVVLVSLAVTSSGLLLTPALGAPADSLTLTVGADPGATMSRAGQFVVSGDSAVDISVEEVDGGSTQVVAGPSSALSSAMQFPAYADSAYPRSVVSLTPTSGHALSPGASDFEYGAVFRLDQTSSGDAVDNGDNLFQRGLYHEGSQFKLQLDHGYASCLVRGSAGRVFVRSQASVTPNEWYRTTCSRVGSKVTVAVTPYAGGATESASTSGATGSLAFDSSRPAAIGGKLNSSGAIVRNASDQFNGAVAKVWIDGL